ncbi:UPF0175 family protein [Paludisphaera sp.]|uniref:UPF0175 family protein n=1 Tax=Paludisphaera sp. TaxID=2017432 RepID=UPI00301D5DD0
MTVSFELPRTITDLAAGTDLAAKAKEALLVELYREARITRHQLATALGLDDYEADGLLKRYGVDADLSMEEFEEQRTFFRRGR